MKVLIDGKLRRCRDRVEIILNGLDVPGCEVPGVLHVTVNERGITVSVFCTRGHVNRCEQHDELVNKLVEPGD